MDIYEEYREKHLKIIFCIIILMAVADYVLMFPLKMGGYIEVEGYYVMEHVILPGFVNLFSYLITRFLVKRDNINPKIKNIVLLTQMAISACVFGVTECTFAASLAAVLIPLFMSTMYGKKLYLNYSMVLALISLILIALLSERYSLDYYPDILFSYLVIILIILIIRVIGTVPMEFSNSSVSAIRSHEDQSQTLEVQLLHDSMTGLYNHTAFYGFLEQLTKHSYEGNKISLAVIDIDNFKKVNDTYGHDKGDEVILYLCSLLQEHFSAIHYVCRYGGEEFAVIFCDIRAKEAKRMMDEVLVEFRTHLFAWKPDPVTFSCGIFEYVDARMSAREFFTITDKVLYRAKDNGKNQCIL